MRIVHSLFVVVGLLFAEAALADGLGVARAGEDDLGALLQQSQQAIESGAPLLRQPSLWGGNDPGDPLWAAKAAAAAQSRTVVENLSRAKTAHQNLVASPHAHVTSDFGGRLDPIEGDWAVHSGVDIGAPIGSRILAAADGLVKTTEAEGGWGLLVEIEHEDGSMTRYAHCSGFAVAELDKVKRGQVVAFVGSTGRSTGPHLHFEVRDARGTPIDPIKALKRYRLDAERKAVDATPGGAVAQPASPEAPPPFTPHASEVARPVTTSPPAVNDAKLSRKVPARGRRVARR
jgi:murein DD-endopeptidase MepM/ murein hydrolase activator NlpD